jgi:hypothetical protein
MEGIPMLKHNPKKSRVFLFVLVVLIAIAWYMFKYVIPDHGFVTTIFTLICAFGIVPGAHFIGCWIVEGHDEEISDLEYEKRNNESTY